MVNCSIATLRNELIKKGMNPREADKLARKHYAYINRIYKSATISKKADIAMSLGQY